MTKISLPYNLTGTARPYTGRALAGTWAVSYSCYLWRDSRTRRLCFPFWWTSSWRRKRREWRWSQKIWAALGRNKNWLKSTPIFKNGSIRTWIFPVRPQKVSGREQETLELAFITARPLASYWLDLMEFESMKRSLKFVRFFIWIDTHTAVLQCTRQT